MAAVAAVVTSKTARRIIVHVDDHRKVATVAFTNVASANHLFLYVIPIPHWFFIVVVVHSIVVSHMSIEYRYVAES
jgi:hypothetical protein